MKSAENDADSRDSSEISAADVAKRLEITPQAVGIWTKRPGAPVRVDGARVWCRWPEFARWREQEMIRQAVKEVTPTATLDEARTRKAIAEAELAEMEVGKARGELVSIEDYEKALGRVLDRLMARLRSLPVRLAHLGDTAEVAIEVEVERVVKELHNFDDDVLDEPDELDQAA